MEKRSFDRHDIDDMQANQRRIEDAGEIKGVGLRVAGVIGGVDADKDFLDQARNLRVSYRDNTPRGCASRGGADSAMTGASRQLK
jgi:hypothetical protein